MLITAFHRDYLAGLPRNRANAIKKSNMKAWSYIGRFIWGFAMVEYQVNQLLQKLLGGENSASAAAASLLLTYTLDLRRKLDVIEIIFKSRGIDESGTFRRVHSLQNLRNVVAHWPFDEDEGGLSCDYINKRGDVTFTKPGSWERDNLIKWVEFDSYDAEASALCGKLEELLNSATPITQISVDFQNLVEEVIRSSENVVRFPRKLRTGDNGEPDL
jgi:hypothetical protein